MMQVVPNQRRDFDATANGNFGAPGPGLTTLNPTRKHMPEGPTPLQHCRLM